MNYAEAAYFKGVHMQHIADWQEVQRVAKRMTESSRAVRQSRNTR